MIVMLKLRCLATARMAVKRQRRTPHYRITRLDEGHDPLTMPLVEFSTGPPEMAPYGQVFLA